jgi:hypothetical protein
MTANYKQKAQPNEWLSFFNDYIKKGITLSLHLQHLSHAFLLEHRKKQSHFHG